MSRKYWSIKHYDTGASAWIIDDKIPRAGIEPFNRTYEATLQFTDLVDGSKAVVTSEHAANWGEITLVFPKQVVTETVKDQFKSYIDNKYGIRIIMPILTGASSYTEEVIEGYMTKYEETWILDNKSNQRFVVKTNIMEFDVE